MKYLRFVSLHVLLTILAIPTFAQTTTQPGVVMEYREDKPQRPLKGVEIEVKYAPSTTSNQKGAFSLQFNRLKPGSKVEVRKISKPGYVVYNDNAVKQWNISNKGTAFTILMADAKWFERVKNSLSNKAIANREKKHKQEVAKLEQQVREGKLSLQEKETQIMELEDEFERLKDSIPAYAEFVTRININECTSQQAKIIRSLKDGEIELDEAIKRLRGLDFIGAYEKACEAKRELESQIHRIDPVKDSSLSGCDNYIAILKLAGGKDNYREIGDILKRAALADTINLERVLDYAQFASQQNDLIEAAHFFKIYVKQIKDKEMLVMGTLGIARGEMQAKNWNSSLFFFDKAKDIAAELVTDSTSNSLLLYNVVQFEKTSLLYDLGRYIEADSIMSIIYPYFESRNDGSINGKRYLSTLQCNWANICRTIGQNDHAEQLLTNSLSLSRDLYELDSLKYGRDLSESLNSMGHFYETIKKYEEADKYYMESLDILTSLFQHNPDAFAETLLKIKTNYAVSLKNQKRFEESEREYLNLIELAKDIRLRNEIAFGRYLPGAYCNLGNLYLNSNRLSEAEQSYNESLSLLLKLSENDTLSYNKELLATYMSLSKFMVNQKKYDKAEEYLTSAIKINERLKSAHPIASQSNIFALLKNLAIINYYKRDFEKAESYFISAIDIMKKLYMRNPDQNENEYISIKYSLGCLYDVLKQIDDAKKQFSEVIELTKGKEIQYKDYIDKINDAIDNWSNN